jgi:hypothetical protein
MRHPVTSDDSKYGSRTITGSGFERPLTDKSINAAGTYFEMYP